MSKPVKYTLSAIAVVLLIIFYIVFDWYKFATSAEIDPKRGLYGNDHLEVWIDINARMPNGMRLWACKTIREREKAVLGGSNTIPFYSCQPDFGTLEQPTSKADAIISAIAQGTLSVAAPSNPTETQSAQFIACIKDALTSGLSPELLDSLNADTPGMDALVALNAAGAAASKDCLAKAGLN